MVVNIVAIKVKPLLSLVGYCTSRIKQSTTENCGGEKQIVVKFHKAGVKLNAPNLSRVLKTKLVQKSATINVSF